MAQDVLRRQLGLAAITAVVMGDMLGSGIFFTPGELAPVAQTPWHIYFFWGICGIITLCGALTLAELCSALPQAGATYHIVRRSFGGFWAFLLVWMQMWVSGPGSVAGVAAVFGDFASQILGFAPAAWGITAIVFFAGVNLLGIRWGGRTQILLTSVKILALLGLILGSLFLADRVPASGDTPMSQDSFLAFIRMVGLGVAAVLFTYDGWIDITHVAGEVKDPGRNLPRGLALGVAGITFLYLFVNYAFLRVVPVSEMKKAPTLIAAKVAEASFGEAGGTFLSALIALSILGALGGLVMTLPRLFYATAVEYENKSTFLRLLSRVHARTAAPSWSIAFCAITSIMALLFFQTFSRLVNFILVPLQIFNILTVASIYRIRNSQGYRTPGYPVTPAIFIAVLLLLLVSALIYRPVDTLIGVALTATGIPFYLWIERRQSL